MIGLFLIGVGDKFSIKVAQISSYQLGYHKVMYLYKIAFTLVCFTQLVVAFEISKIYLKHNEAS